MMDRGGSGNKLCEWNELPSCIKVR